jgi:hypothetical protein
MGREKHRVLRDRRPSRCGVWLVEPGRQPDVLRHRNEKKEDPEAPISPKGRDWLFGRQLSPEEIFATASFRSRLQRLDLRGTVSFPFLWITPGSRLTQTYSGNGDSHRGKTHNRQHAYGTKEPPRPKGTSPSESGCQCRALHVYQGGSDHGITQRQLSQRPLEHKQGCQCQVEK